MNTFKTLTAVAVTLSLAGAACAPRKSSRTFKEEASAPASITGITKNSDPVDGKTTSAYVLSLRLESGKYQIVVGPSSENTLIKKLDQKSYTYNKVQAACSNDNCDMLLVVESQYRQMDIVQGREVNNGKGKGYIFLRKVDQKNAKQKVSNEFDLATVSKDLKSVTLEDLKKKAAEMVAKAPTGRVDQRSDVGASNSSAVILPDVDGSNVEAAAPTQAASEEEAAAGNGN